MNYHTFCVKCIACGRIKQYGENNYYFKFPEEINRCRSWVKALGIRDLLFMSLDELHAQTVCSVHFNLKCINKKGNRLYKTAIPTGNNPPLSDKLMIDFPKIKEEQPICHDREITSIMEPKYDVTSMRTTTTTTTPMDIEPVINYEHPLMSSLETITHNERYAVRKPAGIHNNISVPLMTYSSSMERGTVFGPADPVSPVQIPFIPFQQSHEEPKRYSLRRKTTSTSAEPYNEPYKRHRNVNPTTYSNPTKKDKKIMPTSGQVAKPIILNCLDASIVPTTRSQGYTSNRVSITSVIDLTDMKHDLKAKYSPNMNKTVSFGLNTIITGHSTEKDTPEPTNGVDHLNSNSTKAMPIPLTGKDHLINTKKATVTPTSKIKILNYDTSKATVLPPEPTNGVDHLNSNSTKAMPIPLTGKDHLINTKKATVTPTSKIKILNYDTSKATVLPPAEIKILNFDTSKATVVPPANLKILNYSTSDGTPTARINYLNKKTGKVTPAKITFLNYNTSEVTVLSPAKIKILNYTTSKATALPTAVRSDLNRYSTEGTDIPTAGIDNLNSNTTKTTVLPINGKDSNITDSTINPTTFKITHLNRTATKTTPKHTGIGTEIVNFNRSTPKANGYTTESTALPITGFENQFKTVKQYKNTKAKRVNKITDISVIPTKNASDQKYTIESNIINSCVKPYNDDTKHIYEATGENTLDDPVNLNNDMDSAKIYYEIPYPNSLNTTVAATTNSDASNVLFVPYSHVRSSVSPKASNVHSASNFHFVNNIFDCGMSLMNCTGTFHGDDTYYTDGDGIDSDLQSDKTEEDDFSIPVKRFKSLDH